MTHGTRSFDDFQRECTEIDGLESRILAVLAERTESAKNVVALLEEFSALISNHFMDEGCGVIHDAAEKQVETAEKCRLLCAQHSLFIQRISALLDLARQAEGTNAWWDQLCKQFRDLYVDFEHHEHLGRELFESVRRLK